MKKNSAYVTLSILLCFLLMFFVVETSHATPLSLNYSITDLGGGTYDYEFDLVLDNNDGTWIAGQGWRWLVFGDAFQSSSPLTDFIGDTGDLPIGPWTHYSTSGGGHNGPTLSDVTHYWTPTFIGETLSWSGTSTAYLGQGDLLFSTLAGTLNGGVAADFEVANLVDATTPIPEPTTFALLGVGVLGLVFGMRKRRI